MVLVKKLFFSHSPEWDNVDWNYLFKSGLGALFTGQAELPCFFVCVVITILPAIPAHSGRSRRCVSTGVQRAAEKQQSLLCSARGAKRVLFCGMRKRNAHPMHIYA